MMRSPSDPLKNNHRSQPEVCLALICSNIKRLVLLCLILITPLVKQGTWNGGIRSWATCCHGPTQEACAQASFYNGTRCSGLQRPLFLLCYASATRGHVTWTLSAFHREEFQNVSAQTGRLWSLFLLLAWQCWHLNWPGTVFTVWR